MIYEAIKIWFTQHGPTELNDLFSPDDGQIFIRVIEQILELSISSKSQHNSDATKTSYTERSDCLSWIRKIAKGLNVVPTSFVLHGVKKIREEPSVAGNFGDIYMGLYKEQKVVLKVPHGMPEKPEGWKEFQKEAFGWKYLEHPNILKLYGVSFNSFPQKSIALVSPFMTNGNILQYVKKKPNADKLSLMVQSANGLSYLHNFDPPLVHGDFKGENIMISDKGDIKLSGFEFIEFSGSHGLLTDVERSVGGTPGYMAPELYGEGSEPSRKSDIFAFGVTIIEVYTGKWPLPTGKFTNRFQVATAVLEGRRPEKPKSKDFEGQLWELTEKCWAASADDRPNMDEVLGKLESILEARG